MQHRLVKYLSIISIIVLRAAGRLMALETRSLTECQITELVQQELRQLTVNETI